MTRTLYLFVFGLVVFLSALVIFAPAAVAPRFVQLPDGVKFSAVEGKLWHPIFREVYAHSLPVGDMTVSLSPLSILTGKTTALISLTGNRFEGSGKLTIADTALLENFKFRGKTQFNSGGQALSSMVTLQGERLAWNKEGKCIAARASLITDGISVALANILNDIPETVADITCENGILQVSFSQNLGFGALSGSGVIDDPNALNLALVLRFSDQAVISDTEATFLQDLGFRQRHDGWHSEVKFQ